MERIIEYAVLWYKNNPDTIILIHIGAAIFIALVWIYIIISWFFRKLHRRKLRKIEKLANAKVEAERVAQQKQPPIVIVEEPYRPYRNRNYRS